MRKRWLSQLVKWFVPHALRLFFLVLPLFPIYSTSSQVLVEIWKLQLSAPRSSHFENECFKGIYAGKLYVGITALTSLTVQRRTSYDVWLGCAYGLVYGFSPPQDFFACVLNVYMFLKTAFEWSEYNVWNGHKYFAICAVIRCVQCSAVFAFHTRDCVFSFHQQKSRREKSLRQVSSQNIRGQFIIFRKSLVLTLLGWWKLHRMNRRCVTSRWLVLCFHRVT